MSAPQSLDGPHWTFSLDLYGRPGVPSACLHLQDEFGVDVNVLLVCLFAVSCRGIQIGEHEVAILDDVVKAWRAEVVAPLRAVRRALKGALVSGAEDLRHLVKRAELQAEQVEQGVLAEGLAQMEASAEADPDLLGTMEKVVNYYCSARPGSGDPASARAAILTLSGALTAYKRE